MKSRFSSIADTVQRRIRSAPLWILFILGIVIIGNLVSVFAIDVHPDEAYYWAWSVYPDWSYLDHPPMVGWMIWVVDKLLGINTFTLRLPAVLSWTVAIVCVYRISTELYGDRLYGWLAAAIFSILPVFQAASHIITPDTPLLMFTVLAYYFLLKAVSRQSARYWVITGVMTGMGLLSKYNAVLLPVIILLGLLWSLTGRKHLAKPAPWVASLVAGVLLLPVIYWNYMNHWASFALQIGHGVGAKFSLNNLGVFIGGQLGAALIWIMILMAVASFRRAPSVADNYKPYRNILVAGFWVPLVFFGWAAGTVVGQVNWPAMAYFPGTILLSGMLGHYMRSRDTDGKTGPGVIVALLLVSSCLFSVTLVNVFRFPIAAEKIGLGFLPTNTQLSDTYGWAGLKARIEKISREHHLDNNCRVYLSTKYMWASMIYRFRDVDRFAILPGSTRNQYVNWESRGFFSKRKPCLVVERLSLEKDHYVSEKEWSGIGKWRLADILVTPTSDTDRVYGFYLPVK